MLTLIMHYSRVSAAPAHTYSAAAAVLLTELLKGSISLVIAFTRLDSYAPQYHPNGQQVSTSWSPLALLGRFRRLGKEVFRADCWKLAIPAILYGECQGLQRAQECSLTRLQSFKIISSLWQSRTSRRRLSKSAIK